MATGVREIRELDKARRVNWCGDPTVTFGSYRGIRDSDYKSPIDNTNINANSNAFMNKLGFSDAWLTANVGSVEYPEDVLKNDLIKGWKPLGTTDGNYDIVQSVNYQTDEPSKYYADYINRNENTESGTYTSGTITAADKLDAKFLLNEDSVGHASFSYSNVAGGTVNQQAGEFGPAIVAGSTDQFDPTRTMGELIGYNLPNSMNTPKAVMAKAQGTTASTIGTDGYVRPGTASQKLYTDFNLDDVKFPYYQYAVDSAGMRADSIPSKTKVGYFLIMSDLIDKHEFIGSANGGNPLNCIGILSKNYENNDFYFSFQSPVEFYIKADKTITSIETRIVTPSLGVPVGLDTNSSIIYTIVRPNNIPEPDVAPIAIQQAMDYAIQEQLEIQMGTSGAFGGYMGISNLMGNSSGAGAGLNSLRQSLVSNLMAGGPNMMSNLYGVESDIQMNINRASLGSRQAMIIQSQGALDPADAHVIGQSSEQQQHQALTHADPARAKIPPTMERMIDPNKPFFDADFGIGNNEVPPQYRSPSAESGGGSRGITPKTDRTRASVERHVKRLAKETDAMLGHRANLKMTTFQASRSESYDGSTPAPVTKAMVGGGLGGQDTPESVPLAQQMASLQQHTQNTLMGAFDKLQGYSNESPPSSGPPSPEAGDGPSHLKDLFRADSGDEMRGGGGIHERQDAKTFIELWSGNFDTSTASGRRARNMVHTAISGQTDWDNPKQVPIDILREMSKLGGDGIQDHRGNKHTLDEDILARYRTELDQRGSKRPEKAGGGGKQPLLQEFTQPPTDGHSDGQLSLHDVIHSPYHWLAKGRTHDQKDNNVGFSGKENPYDMRTWNTQKVRNWAGLREKMPMRDIKDHKAYDKDKASGADMTKWHKHTLKEADAGLFQVELDRRGSSKMTKSKRVTSDGKGTIRYNEKAHEPQNYQPHKPHQHSRGISRTGASGGGAKVPGGDGGPPK